MSIKVIIFDFDGVLIDSVNIKNEAFKEIVKNKNETIKKKFIQYHHKNLGISRHIKFKYLLKNLLKKKNINQDISLLSKKFKKLILNKILKKNLNKGVIKFLKKYKKKYTFFVSSGTPEKELKYIIKKKGIENFFSKIYGSPKEKYKHIEEIVKSFNLKKKNIVFVGDGLSDLEAAKKMKLNFIQVGSNFKSKNAKFKIKYFYQLEKLIESKNILNVE